MDLFCETTCMMCSRIRLKLVFFGMFLWLIVTTLGSSGSEIEHRLQSVDLWS
jgi:hypothetical protein